MRKHMIRFFTMLGFLITLSAATAFAQERAKLMVNVPFDFSVANRTMQAGEYTVTERNTTGQTIIIRNNDAARGAVIVIATPFMPKKEAEKPALVFRRYGNQYFLSQVIHDGPTNSLELMKTKAEKRAAKDQANPHLAKANGDAELVTIAARQ